MNPESPITQHFRLSPLQKKALEKLGLFTIKDLLYHFPSRYAHLGEIKNVIDLKTGDEATVYGKISKLKTSKGFRTKIPMASGELEDHTGKIKVVWFNQPYIAKMAEENGFMKLSGKVMERSGSIYLANPEIEKSKELPIDSANSIFGEIIDPIFYAIYGESKGITSKWFYHAIQKILRTDLLDELVDIIPTEILEKYNLPNLKTALIWIHAPKKDSHSITAKKRFAFEEIFLIQLARQKERIEYRKYRSYKINPQKKDVEHFTSGFPFKMTNAQERAVEQIILDFKKEYPMLRLIEGDVGSGKTAVAAIASYVTIKETPNEQNFGNLQVAYMTPTEVLALQQFESFIQSFKNTKINIGLITGSTCKKFPSKVNPSKATDISKAQLLKWVANGEIPILVGTHSLIQDKVKFKNLALAIIDEQHRFGTNQRSLLAKKHGILPHVLSMTATPIPRTLALTIYGDLDLTLLDEMPKGRKIVITEIVTPDKRELSYEKAKKELAEGRQVYVICPRINEPDPDKELALNAKSVKSEATRLKKDIFQNETIGILHSKMTKLEKEKSMSDFASGRTKILVATSVVEVGVNVPNATVMIIEGAERFGLAQLHQLRGRVIRSNHQAYCYVFSETKTKKSLDRLKALEKAKNGFELSEIDLTYRGTGDLAGKKQWGISDIGMEAIKNIKMVEAARNEALNILENDPEFKEHSLIKKTIDSRKLNHFE